MNNDDSYQLLLKKAYDCIRDYTLEEANLQLQDAMLLYSDMIRPFKLESARNHLKYIQNLLLEIKGALDE